MTNNKQLTAQEVEQARLVFTNTLIFETPGGHRYTQDSPILPNVWMAFAKEPRSQQELILTVAREEGTGVAARELRKMLNVLRVKRPKVGDKNQIDRAHARVSYIPGQIAVKLYFDELMRVVLPLTPWWHRMYDRLKKIENNCESGADPADWTPFPQPDTAGKREKDLTDALMLMRREIDSMATNTSARPVHGDASSRMHYIRNMPEDLSWLVRIGGLIGECFASGGHFLEEETSLSAQFNQDFKAREFDQIETDVEREKRQKKERLNKSTAEKTRAHVVRAFVKIYENWCQPDIKTGKRVRYPSERYIWRVTKNRRIHLAVSQSALTVKADAARQLFDISCKKITWAILDSGIDPAHPAFRKTTLEHELETRKKVAKEAGSEGLAKEIKTSDLGSRVTLTLDFTRLRELLDFDIEINADDQKSIDRRERLVTDIAERISTKGENDKKSKRKNLEKAETLLDDLRARISDGKDISWQDLEKAIVVNQPDVPANDHGTHVAGVLGADWIEDFKHEREFPLDIRSRRMKGICPDINLIDVRVFREDGLTDEFELLAAIQFLRWMNERAGSMKVHGANLSLSLIHEVRRFACGQTPICDECNEASALGMVIVAAAGNRGFDMSDMQQISASDSYKTVSITDPGNAANVITVGATHRKRPHEFGVSYFSSRGPTGDGRMKPDLVAPGEKIKGPTPNGREERKDGTSMAAPHVSGAAAMLMARHSELVGNPEKIKTILCETATDLGRERYFQGAGLVDTLRALQSV